MFRISPLSAPEISAVPPRVRKGGICLYPATASGPGSLSHLFLLLRPSTSFLEGLKSNLRKRRHEMLARGSAFRLFRAQAYSVVVLETIDDDKATQSFSSRTFSSNRHTDDSFAPLHLIMISLAMIQSVTTCSCSIWQKNQPTSDFPLTRHSSRSESLGRQTILWKKKEGKDGIGKISFVMSVVGHAGQAPGRPDRPAMDLAMALKC